MKEAQTVSPADLLNLETDEHLAPIVPKPPKLQPGPNEKVIIVRGEKGRMERRIVPDDQVKPPGDIQVTVQEPVQEPQPGQHDAKPGDQPQIQPEKPVQAQPGAGQADPGAVPGGPPGGATPAPGIPAGGIPGPTPGASGPAPGGPPGPPPDFSDLPPGEQAAGAAAQGTEQAAQVDYPAVAGMTFDMLTNILASIFGPEWRPETAQEREMVVASLAAYMKSKQMPDIPPGLMLCLVVAIYSGKRLQAPSTRSKIKLIFAWCKDKFGRFFRKRGPARVAEAPGPIQPLPQPE